MTIDDHNPDTCPLGERLMKNEQEMHETLIGINESLVAQQRMMQNLAAGLAATTKLATDTESKVNGHEKFFMGVASLGAIVLTLFCWVLIEKNEDIKSLNQIAITNQKELLSERSKRDVQIDAIVKEQDRRAEVDKVTMAALLGLLKNESKSR